MFQLDPELAPVEAQPLVVRGGVLQADLGVGLSRGRQPVEEKGVPYDRFDRFSWYRAVLEAIGMV